MRIVKLTQSEFAALPEYSHSVPTGTTIGKRWKAKLRGENNWWMGEYVRELPILTCCRYHRCIAGVMDKEPCHQVRTREGVVYDPKHPELWHEEPNRQVEIGWHRIEVLPLVRRSTAEDDPKYSHDRSGWFINASRDRNSEVARFLKIDKVYCVGTYPCTEEVPKMMFVQPTGHLDERNNKVEYFVVEDELAIKGVIAILARKASLNELRNAQVEFEERMEELSRRVL